MKSSKLVKAASIGLLSLGLTALPFSISASAQDTTNQTGSPAVEDIEFDWGWLGLLGLLGLAGLAGQRRVDDHHQHREYRSEHRTDVPVTPQASNPTDIHNNPRTDVPRYRDPYRDPK